MMALRPARHWRRRSHRVLARARAAVLVTVTARLIGSRALRTVFVCLLAQLGAGACSGPSW